MSASKEQQQHFLPIDEETEAEFFEAPAGELEASVNELDQASPAPSLGLLVYLGARI